MVANTITLDTYSHSVSIRGESIGGKEAK